LHFGSRLFKRPRKVVNNRVVGSDEPTFIYGRKLVLNRILPVAAFPSIFFRASERRER
jgi:hypothetical protein